MSARVPAGVPTGGQFAAGSRPEAGVALPESAPPETPLAAALRAADLPGTFEVTGPDVAVYTDPDGHDYRVEHHDRIVSAQADDVQAYGTTQVFMGDRPLTAEDAVDALRECQSVANDIRGFNDAVANFLSTPDSARGHGWRDPSFDTYTGEATFNRVKIHGFTRDDSDWGNGRVPVATLRVDLTDPDADGSDGTLEFQAVRLPGQGVQFFRGEDRSQPLTRWEREALDGEVNHRLDRGGLVVGLGELLTNSVRRAERRDRGTDSPSSEIGQADGA